MHYELKKIIPPTLLSTVIKYEFQAELNLLITNSSINSTITNSSNSSNGSSIGSSSGDCGGCGSSNNNNNNGYF